jgi:hypothetical protein
VRPDHRKSKRRECEGIKDWAGIVDENGERTVRFTMRWPQCLGRGRNRECRHKKERNIHDGVVPTMLDSSSQWGLRLLSIFTRMASPLWIPPSMISQFSVERLESCHTIARIVPVMAPEMGMRATRLVLIPLLSVFAATAATTCGQECSASRALHRKRLVSPSGHGLRMAVTMEYGTEKSQVCRTAACGLCFRHCLAAFPRDIDARCSSPRGASYAVNSFEKLRTVELNLRPAMNVAR